MASGRRSARVGPRRVQKNIPNGVRHQEIFKRAFCADVKAKCLAAAQAAGMKSPEVLVHPFGTERYGLAVLREGADKRICVYGKQTKTVELTPAT